MVSILIVCEIMREQREFCACSIVVKARIGGFTFFVSLILRLCPFLSIDSRSTIDRDVNDVTSVIERFTRDDDVSYRLFDVRFR